MVVKIMQTFYIQGPTQLTGEISISGSKNTALPLLFVSLLLTSPILLQNVPHLKDIKITTKLLIKIGVKIKHTHSLIFDAGQLTTYKPPHKLSKQIRASIWILSPLLIRFGKAEITYPGGCNIGKRPIDLHIFGLKRLGVQFILNNNHIKAYLNKHMKGTVIKMPKISVGATITIISAAVLAIGITIIKNAACEPEVNDIANYLNKLGAQIFGIGTRTLYIQGVKKLNSITQYLIPPDRIETGTFLIAAASSKGNITCKNTNPKNLITVLKTLHAAGAIIKLGKDWINLNMHNKRPKSVNICTGPYPFFPTDLQPQITLLNTISIGNSIITESIFENRFQHVSELIKMGAKIITHNNQIKCIGVKNLNASKINCTDLRNTATLILAGCIAEGISIVNNVQHVMRGYVQIKRKLNSLGAQIKLI